MANVWTVSDPMNVFAKMDGPVRIVKNKFKCAQRKLAKMMQAALIFSKTISVFVPREPMENSAR